MIDEELIRKSTPTSPCDRPRKAPPITRIKIGVARSPLLDLDAVAVETMSRPVDSQSATSPAGRRSSCRLLDDRGAPSIRSPPEQGRVVDVSAAGRPTRKTTLELVACVRARISVALLGLPHCIPRSGRRRARGCLTISTRPRAGPYSARAAAWSPDSAGSNPVVVDPPGGRRTAPLYPWLRNGIRRAGGGALSGTRSLSNCQQLGVSSDRAARRLAGRAPSPHAARSRRIRSGGSISRAPSPSPR